MYQRPVVETNLAGEITNLRDEQARQLPWVRHSIASRIPVMLLIYA